jgi:TM2 domain-containing membrane protein YozV
MQKTGLFAFILWAFAFVGICGLHRFYVGRPMTGVLWLLTFGLLGVGQLFDLFFLGSMVRQANILNGLMGGVQNNNSNVNTVAPVFNVSVHIPGSPITIDPNNAQL